MQKHTHETYRELHKLSKIMCELKKPTDEKGINLTRIGRLTISLRL